MSDKWWDMPDDELDDLFREASDKVDIPFDQSAFDKLRHKIDNQPAVTPKGTSKKWLLPFALLLLVGVSLVYLFVSKKSENTAKIENGSTKKTESIVSNSSEKSPEIKNYKETNKNATSTENQSNKIDRKEPLVSGSKVSELNNKLANNNPETLLAGKNNPDAKTEVGSNPKNPESSGLSTIAKNNSESVVKSNRNTIRWKKTQSVQSKKTTSPLTETESNSTHLSKNESKNSAGSTNTQPSIETSEQTKNVSKTLSSNTYFSKNWKSKNKKQNSIDNNTNSVSQNGVIGTGNSTFDSKVKEEELVNKTNFYNVNNLVHKNTKPIKSNIEIDLPPFIDSLPRPKLTPKASRFGIRFAISPDINAIENFDYLGFGGSLGLLVEYNIGKRLALQTGIGYSTKKYVGDFEYYHAWPDWTKGHPSKPIEVDGRCKVIDIPINVRFNFLQKPRHSWFISSGVSSYIMLNETYVYSYAWGPTKTTDWSDKSSFYASTLNFSLGFERKLGKHLSLQAEPYFKTPLKGVGRGLVNLYSTGMFISTKYSF